MAATDFEQATALRGCDYAPSYYEATNLNDCDAFMKYAKSIEEIKAEIDNEETFNTKEEWNRKIKLFRIG